jgi:isocitrate dehydrogenase
MSHINIAVAKGDGIGPEIMDAVLSIFQAAKVPLNYHFVEMGKSIYDKGFSTGMTPEAKDTVETLGILFKGPMETPKGKGVKSINVTARKTWSTFANKRVFRTINGVDTVYSRAGIPINLTIVRENIEDTYGGIEHLLTHDVAVCRRFITRPGSLQVHRYAFEMARRQGLKKVTCAHKANIMKLTDGMFLEAFYEVAKDYPDIEANDAIVDDMAMKLVMKPQNYEVVVMTNLQGDIISDLCAGLVGGLGFAPSANIGENICIFEAVHGTAPDIMGKNIANPTALLLSGIMMLQHLGLMEHAETIQNALFYALEEGNHTADFGTRETHDLSTTEFTQKIIESLGKKPVNMPPHEVKAGVPFQLPKKPEINRMMTTATQEVETVIGADLFVKSDSNPQEIGKNVEKILPAGFKLVTMTNRGTQVYPTGSVFTECINQYRLRVEAEKPIGTEEVLKIIALVDKLYPMVSVEWLHQYDGKPGYSLAQGQ